MAARLLTTMLAVLLLSATASATPTITLRWSATTGNGSPGTSTIYVAPGDYVALDIEVNIDAAGLAAATEHLKYDSGALLGFDTGIETPLGHSQVCPAPPNPAQNY